MRRELLDLASDLSRRGEPFVLAVVIARNAPISAQIGDSALVTADGDFHGWVGGSCTRPTVIAEAKKALADGNPRLIALGPDVGAQARPGVLAFPMTCHSGGSVEIHLQPVLPQARLLIYGLSPTARALSRLAQAMGYEVHACDPGADSSAFPGAAAITTDPAKVQIATGSAPVFAVVATHGEWDEQAVTAALAHKPDYLGVVASPKRFAALRTFVAESAPHGSLSAVKNPAGLDIGALSPEEIALSILAEVVKERRGRARSTGLRLAQVPAAPEARDPVCGMMVRIEGAPHQTSYRGQTFFFCCDGCRTRFIAAPDRYLAAGAAS